MRVLRTGNFGKALFGSLFIAKAAFCCMRVNASVMCELVDAVTAFPIIRIINLIRLL